MNQQPPIYIKNMVCPRCITAIKEILGKLAIPYHTVALGEVITQLPLSEKQAKELGAEMQKQGFELLESGHASLIGQIKAAIVEQIHHREKPLTVNFSTYLSEKLHHGYTHLSKLFSSVEGTTIEKFIAKQRIEKVKEWLFYDEMTLSEIAHRLQYSSVAHLSAQFKRETGMTVTQFRKQQKPGHRSLDSL